jgi:hypothetical protein
MVGVDDRNWHEAPLCRSIDGMTGIRATKEGIRDSKRWVGAAALDPGCVKTLINRLQMGIVFSGSDELELVLANTCYAIRHLEKDRSMCCERSSVFTRPRPNPDSDGVGKGVDCCSSKATLKLHLTGNYSFARVGSPSGSRVMLPRHRSARYPE